MNIRNISFFLLACCWLPIAAAGQTFPEGRIDQTAQSYIENTKNSGLVIGLIRGDQFFTRGYGQLDRGSDLSPDGQTIFEIGAVTQVFTTTLALLESHRGAFLLEESIRPYVPGDIDVPDFQPVQCVEITIPNPGKAPKRILTCSPDPLAERVCIAFCDLATHTSGLPNSPAENFIWVPFMDIRETGDPCPDFTREMLYANLGGYELKNTPGTEFRYSNLGIAVLGNLLPDITGVPLETLLERYLTTPLKLPDTGFRLTEAQRARLAPGHDVRGRRTDPWPASAMSPSCGLKSTTKDLLNFLKANLRVRDEELDYAFEAARQARIDLRFPGWNRSSQAGYGWLISLLSEESNLPVTWIAGGTSGHRAFIGFIKDTRTGVVVLANNAEPVTELGFTLLGLLNER